MRIGRRKKTSPLSLVGAVVVVLGFFLSMFPSPAMASEFWVNQGDRDLYFTVTTAETLVFRTYAQQYGIDSMLWLYNQDGQTVAQNDDYFGLDSYISYPAQPGIYRLRAGVCCGNPNAWYGTSYRVSTSTEPTSVPSTTTTSTSTTTTTVPPTIGEPRNMSVTNSGNGVNVSWDAPNTGNTQPERYAVMWRCQGCQGRVVPTTNTSVFIPYTTIDDDGPIGQDFTFMVRSDNDTLSLYSSWTAGETVYVGPVVPTTGHSGGGCGPYYPRLVLGRASGGPVWGSNPYTDDSDFSVAAVNAGIVQAGEWVVIEPYWVNNYQSYGGSNENGTSTSDWGSSWCGYYIKASGTPTPTSTTTTSTTTTSQPTTTTTEPERTTTTTSTVPEETTTTSQPEPTTSQPTTTSPAPPETTEPPTTTTTSTVPPTRNVTTTTRPEPTTTTTTEVRSATTTLPATTTTQVPEPASNKEDETPAPSVMDDPKVVELLEDMGFSEEEVQNIGENADALVEDGFTPEQALAIAAEAEEILQEGFSEEDALRVAVEDSSPLAATLGKSTRVKAKIGPISLRIVVTPTERRSIIAVGATMVFGGATILSGSSVSSAAAPGRRGK